MINSELNVNKWVYSLLPLFILLHVLWFNILPFGYEGEYSLMNDPQYFSLEGFSKKECDKNDNCYYKLEKDTGYVIFHSPFVMNNAKINVTIEGENISLAPQNIDISNITWDYNWNFEKSVPTGFNLSYKNESLKKETEFRACGMIFDSNTRVYLPGSKDDFENGPFMIFVEWTPFKAEDRQQIVGHYNWEFYQNKNSLSFQVGRMDNSSGPFYTITYPIEENFFNKTNNALLIYNPSENGYIEMYVNGKFVERKYISNQTIMKDYGNNDFGLGWTTHNYESQPYFNGCLNEIKFNYLNLDKKIISPQKVLSQNSIVNGEYLKIPIINNGNLNEFKLLIKNG